MIPSSSREWTHIAAQPKLQELEKLKPTPSPSNTTLRVCFSASEEKESLTQVTTSINFCFQACAVALRSLGHIRQRVYLDITTNVSFFSVAVSNFVRRFASVELRLQLKGHDYPNIKISNKQ